MSVTVATEKVFSLAANAMGMQLKRIAADIIKDKIFTDIFCFIAVIPPTIYGYTE